MCNTCNEFKRVLVFHQDLGKSRKREVTYLKSFRPSCCKYIISIYTIQGLKNEDIINIQKITPPSLQNVQIISTFLKSNLGRFWYLVVRSSYMCTLNWCDFYMFYLDLSCLIIPRGFEVCFKFISMQFLVKNVFLIFFYQSQKIKTNSVFLSLFKFTTTGT